MAGEVMHPEIGPVRAQILGRDGEVDRLQQGVGRRPRLRLRRRGPVAEGEETDVFHGYSRGDEAFNSGDTQI